MNNTPRRCSCTPIRHKECGCKLRRDLQGVGDNTGWVNYWCSEHRLLFNTNTEEYRTFKREWIGMIQNV